MTQAEQRYLSPCSPFIRDVSQASGIPEAEICGPSRRGDIVRARKLVMWKAHNAGLSSVAIGRALGRDHTTVLSGIKSVARELAR